MDDSCSIQVCEVARAPSRVISMHIWPSGAYLLWIAGLTSCIQGEGFVPSTWHEMYFRFPGAPQLVETLPKASTCVSVSTSLWRWPRSLQRNRTKNLGQVCRNLGRARHMKQAHHEGWIQTKEQLSKGEGRSPLGAGSLPCLLVVCFKFGIVTLAED